MEIVNHETMIETQRNLEELFSRHQLMDVLREEFSPLAESVFEKDVLAQIYLHKQCDVPTMVGLFSPKWGSPQEVADQLYDCVDRDLLDFDTETKKFTVKYVLTEDVEDMLARYQFPLPMVVKPKKLTSNRGGSGYLNSGGSIVLNGSDVFKDEDMCLDHLNRANSVALELNLDVATSESGKFIEPTRKDGETWTDYRKRCKQAETFYNTSMEIMESMFMLGNKMWLTHKYDRRGRTYSVGYHVNSQGTDYNKAVLELADKEVIK